MESQVFTFVECVNNHDVAGMSALMSDDYLYIDPLGHEFRGKQTIIDALEKYFKWFPDYAIECSLLFKNEYVIGLFGSASGTLAENGVMNPGKRWKIPASWRVIVREGLIAEWQVYCDTRKVMEVLSTLLPTFPQPQKADIDLSRKIEKSVTVMASADEVWNAWTTLEGVTSFFAPKANIDLSVGGRYEMLFNPQSPAGEQGGEGLRMLSFIPGKMLSFEWNAPPQFPNVRKEKSWVVVELSEKDGRTGVTLTHMGWRAGEEWDKVYEYFLKAWNIVLGRLKYRFSSGPVDWKAPYTPDLKTVG